MCALEYRLLTLLFTGGMGGGGQAGETSAKLEESYRQLSQIEGDVVREKKAGAEWERKLKLLQGEKEGSGLEAQKREENLEKRVFDLKLRERVCVRERERGREGEGERVFTSRERGRRREREEEGERDRET